MKLHEIEIVGATCERISHEKRNENLFYYEVRHDDCCVGEPISIQKSVMVNHWGTIITKQPISDLDNGCLFLSDEESELINEALATLSWA